MSIQQRSAYNILTLTTLIIIVRLSLILGTDDGWENWSNYTDCSRTCGGGVQQRTRYCLAERYAGSQCHGENIQYQSCSVQECPSSSIDFRSYQCISHSIPPNITNATILVSWRSYFDPQVPCALICNNDKGDIKKLHETVIDGTNCDNGDNFGICINGFCKPIGCDHILGSTKTEDKCLVCGGNGASCQTVSRSAIGQIAEFNKKRNVATIPGGATKVTITLTSSTPSTLELNSDDGESLILPEALTTFTARKVAEFADSHFSYKIIENGIKLTARGPLNKALHLIIGNRMKLKRHSPLVFIEYSISKSKVLKRSPQNRYSWVFGSWTSCSQKCGIGYQLRAVSCIDHETGGAVIPQLCPQNEMPVRNQTCTEGTCHTSSTDEYKWVPGNWGECSMDCGLGEQTQIMHCIQTGVTGNSSYISDDVCLQHVGAKPVLLRVCNGEADYCPYWATGSWSECSVTCGFGSQTRSIYCQRDPADDAKDPIVLNDSVCTDENKPQQVQTCSLDQCADGTNNIRTFEQLREVSRHVVDCRTSRFGCCPDNLTSAKGSFYYGCTNQLIAGVSDPCDLPSDTGSCTNYTIRWYFDSKEKACQRFWYGGCQGNENRFDDSDSCRNRCLKKSSCGQLKDAGTCRNYTSHWYFETSSGTCRQFWYGGCGGNSNKFASKEECETKCIEDEESVPYTRPLKIVLGCAKSEHGCCPDQQTPAEGPNYLGCQKCQDSTYGCCADGVTPAEGPNQDGCDIGSGGLPCESTEYGCCDDAIAAASGPFGRGCGDTLDSEDRVIGTRNRSSTEATLITETCTAPVSRDLCTQYSVKWRFDNQKQECVRHWWGGCKDNGNTFESQGDCEAECMSNVVIMNPDVKSSEKCAAPLSRDLCTEYSVKWRFDNQKQECVRHWWGGCKDNGNVFESQGDCEAECMNTVIITNPNIEDTDFVNICDMPKDVGPCTDSFLRYYYDPKDRKCRAFYYGGCQGNENNFVEIEDCHRECMGGLMRPEDLTTPHAPVHETLKFPSGQVSSVVRTAVEPTEGIGSSMTTVERTESKDPAVVCLMEVALGSCNANIKRLYYNHQTGTCLQFVYGGCGGNNNNFETIEQCNNFCNDQEVCLKSMDIGQCHAALPRYFFDSQTGSCQNFLYGGCQGNLNNFATKEACDIKCSRYRHAGTQINVVTAGGNKELDVCQLNPEKGSCRGYNIKWYYSAARNRCVRFVYTGCDGNGNQFDSEEQCNERCLKKEFTDGGNESASTIRPAQTTKPTVFHSKTHSSSSSRSKTVTEGPVPCHYSNYGCCEDGVTAAEDSFRSNCEDSRVIVQPVTSGDYKVIFVRPGTDAFLKCTLRGHGVLWYHDGFLLASSPRVQVYNNGTLALMGVTEDMSGMYTCRISNGNYIPQLEKFKVEIYVPISLLPGPALVSVKPGGNAFFHCQAVGSPQPQISWNRHGKVLQSNNHYSVFGNGTLIIHSVQIEDAGEYDCSAENGVAVAVRRKTNLKIKESVGADIQRHQGIFMEGETIQLHCKGTGYPTPQLEWVKEGNVLKSEGKVTVRNGDLIISAASIEDAGMYKCIASSERDKVEDVTTVQIKLYSPQSVCEDTMGRTKCHLIVAGRLCGFRIFTNKCCQSCRKAGVL